MDSRPETTAMLSLAKKINLLCARMGKITAHAAGVRWVMQ